MSEALRGYRAGPRYDPVTGVDTKVPATRSGSASRAQAFPARLAAGLPLISVTFVGPGHPQARAATR